MFVGFLGTIPFVASRGYVRTFDDYKRQGDARWADHEIIGEKQVSEFLGENLEEISFTMLFRKDNGVNPQSEVDTLRELKANGTPVPLVLGFKVIGDGLWTVRSLDYSVDFWDKWGHPQAITANVSLKEYAEGKATLKEAFKGLIGL
nr:MAG TPA: hypothetical protein [Caudoviricetes sp.]